MNEKIGIVVSEFYPEMTMNMLKIAKEQITSLGGETKHVLKVPGAFDMPLAIKKLLELEEINAVVTLGAVIQGRSDHDCVVANNAARKMADLSLEYSKPVSLGVMGPRISKQEAEDSMEKYSKAAVGCVFKMLKSFEELKNQVI